MKNGYMFFLNLGTVTYMARVFLLISGIALLSVDGFYQKVLVGIFFAVFFVISIIKAPSDKDVMRAIDFFRNRFKEKIGESGHTFSMNSVKVIEGYRVKGKMKIKRSVGYDVIYPNLVSFAIAREGKGSLMIYADELCLLRRGEPNFNRCIVDSQSLEITAREEDDVVFVNIRCPIYKEGIDIIVKNDFHYREFMDTIKYIK